MNTEGVFNESFLSEDVYFRLRMQAFFNPVLKKLLVCSPHMQCLYSLPASRISDIRRVASGSALIVSRIRPVPPRNHVGTRCCRYGTGSIDRSMPEYQTRHGGPVSIASAALWLSVWGSRKHPNPSRIWQTNTRQYARQVCCRSRHTPARCTRVRTWHTCRPPRVLPAGVPSLWAGRSPARGTRPRSRPTDSRHWPSVG